MRPIDADELFDVLKASGIEFMSPEEILHHLKDIIDKSPTLNNIDNDKPRRYLVVCPNDNVEVLLLKNKEEDTWSFVNVTKGHVCPCKFPSIDAAIQDMDRRMENGELIGYVRIN